jgi:hypothetical protein
MTFGKVETAGGDCWHQNLTRDSMQHLRAEYKSGRRTRNARTGRRPDRRPGHNGRMGGSQARYFGWQKVEPNQTFSVREIR